MIKKDEGLRFSLKRASVPVTMTDEAGKDRIFTLREFNDEARDEYLEILRGKGFTSDQATEARSFAGMQSELVSRCLYDDKETLVPLETIRKDFPASVVTVLFMKAMQINGLTEEALDKAKNA